MNNSNGSNEDEVKEEMKCGDLTIFNLPLEDIEFFKQLTRIYGKKGFVAFRALIDGYGITRILMEMQQKLDILEKRIDELEKKEIKELKVKTFGGGEI